jgi:hypothetical protein
LQFKCPNPRPKWFALSSLIDFFTASHQYLSMKPSLLLKVVFALYFSFLISLFSFSQDTSICYLRDPGGRIREHNVDFLKMKLDVKFNVKEGRVIGNVKYDFHPIQYLADTLFLDAPGIDIKKVLVDGIVDPFTIDSNGVTIRFPQPLDWNKRYKLEISYEATPRKGLYFIGWDVESKNETNDRYFTRKQIWTQGQGIDNRHWIPCYDDVNDKMVTETVITFDSAYTVISNGVLKSKTKNADGTATWHYAMSKPMVPYLIMIGIDKYAYKDFKSKNGNVSRQYYYADHPETAEPTYAYSAEMMDWLQNETEVKYPWETYCNVPVQDFMYGAMENTTATVYGDFYLCDNRGNLDRPYVGTNAHELTHQWFGDYITEYSSSHHWLHESFATYYSKQFIHQTFGEDRYEYDRRNEQWGAINADKKDRFPVANSRGGSNRHYPKGSAVIDMLRYVVGDSVFKKTITEYLKKHAYSNVLNEDFKMAFMETAGVNLDWFFDEWVYRSGFPEFDVKYERQNNRVAFVVNQLQKVDELTSYFKMPIAFEVHFKDGSSSVKKEWLSHASDTVYVDAPSGKDIDYTLFDPGSTVIKLLSYKKNFEELSAQAEKASHFIDRYDAVFKMRDTTIEGKRGTLLSLYAKGNYYPIQNEILFQLSKDSSPLAIELFRKALHDKDLYIRRAAVDYLGEYPDNFPGTLLSDVEMLLNDSSYYTVENVLRKLCKNNPDKSAVQRYLKQTEGIYGLNDNVRIAWLELNINEADSIADKPFLNQLIAYSSNRYEFRTRVRAIERLEVIKYCNEALIKNLFNAVANPNSRLSGPANKLLKTLFTKPANLEMAKGVYAIQNWEDWEKKAIEPLLK